MLDGHEHKPFHEYEIETGARFLVVCRLQLKAQVPSQSASELKTEVRYFLFVYYALRPTTYYCLMISKNSMFQIFFSYSLSSSS